MTRAILSLSKTFSAPIPLKDLMASGPVMSLASTSDTTALNNLAVLFHNFVCVGLQNFLRKRLWHDLLLSSWLHRGGRGEYGVS